jgi:hypothetical protein
MVAKIDRICVVPSFRELKHIFRGDFELKLVTGKCIMETNFFLPPGHIIQHLLRVEYRLCKITSDGHR